MGAPRSPRSPHIVSRSGNNFLLVVKQHQAEAMPPKTACAAKTVVSLGLRTHAMFRAYAGHPSKFTIIARDDEGHVMTRGGAKWERRFLGPSKETVYLVVDHHDGIYTGIYTCPFSGEYTLHVRLQVIQRNKASKAIDGPGSPFYLRVGPRASLLIPPITQKEKVDLNLHDVWPHWRSLTERRIA